MTPAQACVLELDPALTGRNFDGVFGMLALRTSGR